MSSILLTLVLLCQVEAPKIPVSIHSIHDGDTMVVTIHLPFGVDLPNRSIRAAGYDAWEVSRTRRTVKVTQEEIKKGIKARDELKELLLQEDAQVYVQSSGKKDPYGRESVYIHLYADNKWTDIADWMKQKNHVR